MPRYKLVVEYDGTKFCGWQQQRCGRSVQGVMQDAIMQFSGQSITVFGAGRTDAGVHALGQVAHVDFDKNLGKTWSCEVIMSAMNHFLRNYGVVVISVELVNDEFHARFSATMREYIYKIVTRRAPLAVDCDRAWHVNVPLNVVDMQHAAKHFIGTHDFSSFRAAACQANNAIRTVNVVDVCCEECCEDGFMKNTKRGMQKITINVAARSFLHNQVRIMVGTLMQVGMKKIASDDVAAILLGGDRTFAGETAPAHGLYLRRIVY